jgi:acetyl esterase/lipase
MVVVNVTHRAAVTGARFSGEVEDVTCSIDFAVARAAGSGLNSGPVVVVGHSSGAHLAALAVLGGGHVRGVCPYSVAVACAFVGLSGLYDVGAVPDVAEPLFGVAVEDDPDRWRRGNAFTWVRERPSLPVFVGHGVHDELVPTWFTTSFAEALQEAGHQVHVEIFPGLATKTPAIPMSSAHRWLSGSACFPTTRPRWPADGLREGRGQRADQRPS